MGRHLAIQPQKDGYIFASESVAMFTESACKNVCTTELFRLQKHTHSRAYSKMVKCTFKLVIGGAFNYSVTSLCDILCCVV